MVRCILCAGRSPFIPESVASKEELETLTAKSFRNWGAAHLDPVVNRDTIEAHDHSEAIDKLHYRVKSRYHVNAVNRVVMNMVMDKTKPEHV